MERCVASALIHNLQNLGEQDFKRFKDALNRFQPKQDYDHIPWGWLEKADVIQVKSLLINYYREDYALEVAARVLDKINQKPLADALRKLQDTDPEGWSQTKVKFTKTFLCCYKPEGSDSESEQKDEWNRESRGERTKQEGAPRTLQNNSSKGESFPLVAPSSGKKETEEAVSEGLLEHRGSQTNTPDQRRRFFRILKRLLRQRRSLRDGDMGEELNEDNRNGESLQLVYGEKECEVNFHSPNRALRFRVSTLDIYLEWCNGPVDFLNLKNLQRVQNEMHFLGALSNELKACFNLTRNKFVEQSECFQKNTTLELICGDITLTLVSGAEEKVTVLYDNAAETPRWIIKRESWWVRLWRWWVGLWNQLCEKILQWFPHSETQRTYASGI